MLFDSLLQTDHDLFSFFFFFFNSSRQGFSFCSSGCPGTHYVYQAGLELRDRSTCSSQVLRLKECVPTASQLDSDFQKWNEIDRIISLKIHSLPQEPLLFWGTSSHGITAEFSLPRLLAKFTLEGQIPPGLTSQQASSACRSLVSRELGLYWWWRKRKT